MSFLGFGKRSAETRKSSRGRVGRVVQLGAAVLLLGYLSPWRLGVVKGESMMPTLQSGQPFLYERRVSTQVGDVVLLEMCGSLCVKRIYATGGEVFWALRERKHHRMITPINGAQHRRFARMLQRLQLGYCELIRYQVPLGAVFVVGDGTTSLDSRQLGAVPQSNLRGRVVNFRAEDWTRVAVERSFPPPPVKLVRRASAE